MLGGAQCLLLCITKRAPACREKANKYTQEELRLMKTQDVKHIALQAQAEAKVGAASSRPCCLWGAALLASAVLGLSHAMPAAYLLVCLGKAHIGVADTGEACTVAPLFRLTLAAVQGLLKGMLWLQKLARHAWPTRLFIYCCICGVVPCSCKCTGSVSWLQKLEKLRSELHFIGTAARNTHTVFVDNDGQAQAFSPGESRGFCPDQGPRPLAGLHHLLCCLLGGLVTCVPCLAPLLRRQGSHLSSCPQPACRTGKLVGLSTCMPYQLPLLAQHAGPCQIGLLRPFHPVAKAVPAGCTLQAASCL